MISYWVNILNSFLGSASLITPISMFFAVNSPSNESLSVRIAVWIASSISKSSEYLFSRKPFAVLDPLPNEVAFQL